MRRRKQEFSKSNCVPVEFPNDDMIRTVYPVLERYRTALFRSHGFDAGSLERELRDAWDTGYKDLKWLMCALAEHGRYQEVAAYYMEHSNAPGVVMEFQGPLAALYGVKSFHHSVDVELKKDQFWERAFAANPPDQS